MEEFVSVKFKMYCVQVSLIAWGIEFENECHHGRKNIIFLHLMAFCAQLFCACLASIDDMFLLFFLENDLNLPACMH